MNKSSTENRPRIKIEFFKGIIGSMVSIILWEFNGIFFALTNLSDQSETSIFGVLEILAFLGIFAFPIWYWIFYPLIMYSLDESGITLNKNLQPYSQSEIDSSTIKVREKAPGETKTSLILIFSGLTAVSSLILAFLVFLFWFIQTPQEQKNLSVEVIVIIGFLIILSIISSYFTKMNYEAYQELISEK